jgi:hypothetical protein
VGFTTFRRVLEEGAVMLRFLFVIVVALVCASSALAQDPPVGVESQGVYETEDPSCGPANTDSLLCATAARCKTVYAWKGWKHPVLGYFYWKYYQQIRWCWRSGKLTYAGRVRWADCCLTGSGWNFEGHIGSQLSGGASHTYFRAWTQGKFKQCYAYCFTSKTPWVRITGHAGGSWSWSAGV